MNKIFISYRRADSAGVAGRIYDYLARRFGRPDIVMDVDTIPVGVDFRDYISEAMSECALVLVIIGERWADIQDANGRRRLEDPDDIVRFELLAAKERGLFIIPVQLGRVRQDRPLALPPSLEFLGTLGRSYLDIGASFAFDMDFLVLRVERTLALPDARIPPRFNDFSRRPTREGLSAWTWFLLEVIVLSIVVLWNVISIISLGRQEVLATASWLLTTLVLLIIGLLSLYSVYTQWFGCLTVVAAWAVTGYLAGNHLQLISTTHVGEIRWASHAAIVTAVVAGFYGFAINLTLFRRWRGVALREYSDYRREQRRQWLNRA